MRLALLVLVVLLAGCEKNAAPAEDTSDWKLIANKAWRLDDPERGVTCYAVGGFGVSCVRTDPLKVEAP
jgi:hypothetical protein